MLCSHLLKKLEHFHKNMSRIEYIYILQMMEYKKDICDGNMEDV